MILNSGSEAETREIGKLMGQAAAPGDIVCLDGDLGAGKTVFAKGFAAGLGITEPVVSPTFTIIREYEGGRLPLYHFDVYRIGDPGEMDAIGYDEYFYGDGACLVEWSELIAGLIPENAVRVRITRDMERDADFRRIEITRLQDGLEKGFRTRFAGKCI